MVGVKSVRFIDGTQVMYPGNVRFRSAVAQSHTKYSYFIERVRGPLRDGIPWARTFIIRSLVLWFVLDTGMSLVLGYPTHAIFNIPFAVALGLPLYWLGKEKLK